MYYLIHKMNKSLFNKGKEKVIECFFNNKDKEIYFSEILRETNLTPNTTLKHLQSLKENDIIKINKSRAHTFYKINQLNPYVYSLFSYFDYKKLNNLSSQRKRAILEYIDKLPIKPLIVIVFGSTARGTYKNASDIDILLIYNKKEKKHEKLRNDIESITGFNIHPFIINYIYFKEQILTGKDKVVTHAIKTGFVITGHYYFYKEVLR